MCHVLIAIYSQASYAAKASVRACAAHVRRRRRAAGVRSCLRLSATISNINDHQPTYYYPTAAGLTETMLSFGIFSFGDNFMAIF